jgi:spore coat polysaccharide biosynthesis protein SpsF (cytidylyltransferase family)
MRITVDTQEDFDRAKELYSGLKDSPGRYRGDVIIKRYAEIFQ